MFLVDAVAFVPFLAPHLFVPFVLAFGCDPFPANDGLEKKGALSPERAAPRFAPFDPPSAKRSARVLSSWTVDDGFDRRFAKAPVFASAYRSSWPTKLAISRASAFGPVNADAGAGAESPSPKSPRSAFRASRSARARIACGDARSWEGPTALRVRRRRRRR